MFVPKKLKSGPIYPNIPAIPGLIEKGKKRNGSKTNGEHANLAVYWAKL